MDGILLVKKEKGYTSRDIVNLVGKFLSTKKIGHTGTLDPMAEGLLVLCVGKGTKLVEVLTHETKEYEGEITLGISTDTYDKEGTILEECSAFKTKEEIEHALSSLVGTYLQEVPIYSAVKKDGKKLYQYAREGNEVELPKREVTIFHLDLTSEITYPEKKTIFSFCAKVSKGTYIRSLACDIAKKLNTIGMLSKLNRTKVGEYSIQDADTLEDIEKGKYHIISIPEALKNIKQVLPNPALENKIRNGALIENHYEEDVILFLDKNNEAIALYKVYEKDKTKMKPWKMF